MFGDVAAPGVHIVPVSRQERATSLISVTEDSWDLVADDRTAIWTRESQDLLDFVNKCVFKRPDCLFVSTFW